MVPLVDSRVPVAHGPWFLLVDSRVAEAHGPWFLLKDGRVPEAHGPWSPLWMAEFLRHIVDGTS